MKVTKVFSGPLFRQSLRSNRILALAMVVIMTLMCVVITYASNMFGTTEDEVDYTDAQSEFYSYLYVLASYNEMAGTDLSYEDFSDARHTSDYETAFAMGSQQSDTEFTVEGFQEVADFLSQSEVGLDTYISQFEYVYALGGVTGCFSGEALDMQTMLTNMLEIMGVSTDLVEEMSEVDTSAMLNQMYFTVIGLLPMIILIIFAGNALIVDQVDKGSMAYILSTPTKRSAVAITQLIYMLVIPLLMIAFICVVKCLAVRVIFGEVVIMQYIAMYAGMYILVEAMASLCYLGSCLFDLSRYSLAFGGGLNIWFFLASLLGMFGSDSLIQMGVGVESLSIFNKLTLIGLYDIDALGTVGSGSVDFAFVPKLIILAVIAIVCYIVGAIRFQKKDLPL